MCWGAGCSLSRAEGFSWSCGLDVLYGGPGIRKLTFWYKKNITLFQLYRYRTFFPIFVHQNPGSSVLSLKCWIRNRTQWIRIRNTVNFLFCNRRVLDPETMSPIQAQFFALAQKKLISALWKKYSTISKKPGSSASGMPRRRSGMVRLPDTGLELWNWNRTAVYFGMPRRCSAGWWGYPELGSSCGFQKKKNCH